MCGIAGIVNLHSSRAVTEGALRQMLALLRHRGPDQFGVYVEPRVGLGSARLSILDLSGGQQPICNEAGTRWIVYNGEVFNYLELRAELERAGHRFTTQTDTEVVLHLYDEYGPECLSRLNGQFALAIWDAQRRSLFLARDRVGIRPLFYTIADGALIFGSEIKSLCADDRVRARINPVALDQVFTYWSTLTPGTAFQQIREVPPGHWLLAEDGQIRVTRYWQLNYAVDETAPVGSSSQSFEDRLAEFQELLIDSARIRLRADVPVGAYLSGGLDSSVIASIVRRFTSNKLETFSIAFDDPHFDEREYQTQMARHLNTTHHCIRVNYADIARVFSDVVWHTETPILRTSPAPMFLLSRLVRDKNFKVVLTGEGADEILAGYDIFKEAKLRRFWARCPDSRLRPLLFSRLYGDIATLKHGPATPYLAAFFGNGLKETGAFEYSHRIRWLNTSRTKRFFSDEMKATLAHTEVPAITYPPEFASWGPLERAQYLEASIFMSQYLLSSQGDRVGMAHSIEGRFPFLDYRVIEFCNRLPARDKLRGLNEKYLLKRLARNWLPGEICQRRKRPYRAPVYRSLVNKDNQDFVQDLLSERQLKAAGFFKPEAVAGLLAKIHNDVPIGETDEMALAGIVSTQLLNQHFVTGFRMPQPLSERDPVKVVQQS